MKWPCKTVQNLEKRNTDYEQLDLTPQIEMPVDKVFLLWLQEGLLTPARGDFALTGSLGFLGNFNDA